MKKESKSKAAARKRSRVLKALLVIALLCIIFVGYVFIRHALMGFGSDGQWLYIPKGSSEEAVKDSIMTLGDDMGGATLQILTTISSINNVKPGAYRINRGEKAFQIARRLTYGNQNPVKVTFNNIRTMSQLAERVSRSMCFTAEDFLTACDSILPSYGFEKPQYPAAFFPDTYEFYWTEDANGVVERLVGFRNGYWTDERRALAESMGLKPVDVAIIASIVEEESAKTDEHAKIGRLYINRVQRGMKLQADPTIKFALGNFTLRRITAENLKVDSPYNTYKHAGLPPGPIRIPDKRTIERVLTSEKHNYIYMCAKEDFSGYHNFAADYATHSANARRYRAALDRRGITN